MRPRGKARFCLPDIHVALLTVRCVGRECQRQARTCRHMSARPATFFCSSFTQPSATWLRQISAACRFFQSASCACRPQG